MLSALLEELSELYQTHWCLNREIRNGLTIDPRHGWCMGDIVSDETEPGQKLVNPDLRVI